MNEELEEYLEYLDRMQKKMQRVINGLKLENKEDVSLKTAWFDMVQAYASVTEKYVLLASLDKGDKMKYEI